jgi:hypothetical protein
MRLDNTKIRRWKDLMDAFIKQSSSSISTIWIVVPSSRGCDVMVIFSEWCPGMIFGWIRESPPSIMVTKNPNYYFRNSRQVTNCIK